MEMADADVGDVEKGAWSRLLIVLSNCRPCSLPTLMYHHLPHLPQPLVSQSQEREKAQAIHVPKRFIFIILWHWHDGYLFAGVGRGADKLNPRRILRVTRFSCHVLLIRLASHVTCFSWWQVESTLTEGT